jgi:GNAT superfamily N-acetyltransferase
MKIRFAKPSDVSGFALAGSRVHGATRFQSFDYDVERVAQSLGAIVANPAGPHCFIVAVDEQEEPIGWLIGCIECHFFSDRLVASIINYGVLPERRMGGAGLRLLTAFRRWAQNRGAVELNAGVNSGTDLERVDRFLRRLGFKFMGGNYSMNLGR